jgi:putative ABC transport system substrate-binding protein
LNVELLLLDVRKPEDLEAAFRHANERRVAAILVGNDTVFTGSRPRVVALAEQHRIPALYQERDWVVAGGLVSYGVNFSDLYRRSAAYVNKILKGAKPSDLPVEQPTKLDLVINLKTANALGLTLPPLLLARADEVIE